MSVALVVEPDVPPMSWDVFCASRPNYSIALDGYVHGGPQFSLDGPMANFNHHEGVDRLSTRATCAQVLMAIRQGLFSSFRRDGVPTAYVYVNDCDEDVCTAWTLLRHPHLVTSTMNPVLNRLVSMEDMLDSTAGGYPFPADLPALQEMAWIFQPYRLFRSGGGLSKKSPIAFRSVIEDVEARIIKHLTGRGDSIPLDTRYSQIDRVGPVVIVTEEGAQARTGMFADGIRMFVSVRPGDHSTTYTIGKMSKFEPLDLDVLTRRLNEAEGCTTDRWGGADIIIGSPRVGGSKLTLGQIKDLIGATLADRHAA